MNTKFGLLGLVALSTACAAFKGQESTIDTAAVGPTAVEPGDEPSSEPSEPGSEPSNEPADETDTQDTVDPNELDCKWDPIPTNDLPQYQCASGRLFDGDVVDATTEGATNYFTRSVYSGPDWGCSATWDGDYNSPEHAFIFVHPANNSSCEIELETRCGDFDLLAFKHNVEADECPIAGDPLWPSYTCEMSDKRGVGRTESLMLAESSFEEQIYMIVVDAPEPTEEWFRLSVDCCPGLQGCN
jgi:hypothetical protein